MEARVCYNFHFASSDPGDGKWSQQQVETIILGESAGPDAKFLAGEIYACSTDDCNANGAVSRRYTVSAVLIMPLIVVAYVYFI